MAVVLFLATGVWIYDQNPQAAPVVTESLVVECQWLHHGTDLFQKLSVEARAYCV